MINPEFGYYVVGDVKFEKKIEALIYSKAQRKPVSWYFQDEIYSKYPWHIEPIESLDELYNKRARELREKYDYLILCFSGGADSFNVLESFIHQNIHLDEIITLNTGYTLKVHANLNSKDTSNDNLPAEHVLNAILRLKYASEKLPKTKITIVDDTESLFNNLKNYEDEEWIFKRNDHLNPFAPARFNFFEIKDIRERLDKYKSIGIIYGRDKPKLRLNGNKIFTAFSDVALNTVRASSHNSNYNNITSEYFYWNSSCLPMLAKQAHTVKRWLENNPSYLTHWKDPSLAENRSMQESLLRNIIYTTWNENWFQCVKNTYQWSNGEDWFSRDPQLKREYMLWKRGFNYATNLLREHIRFTDNIPNGFNIFSKLYLIGSINIKQSF